MVGSLITVNRRVGRGIQRVFHGRAAGMPGVRDHHEFGAGLVS
jgi:hypothetical protein